MAEKELRYILRSLTGKMVLVSAPLLALVFVFVFSEKLARPFFGLLPAETLLCANLVYTIFLANNMVNNAYAWEGRGAQAYYLLPAPLRSVIAGKNLGLWLFEGLLFVLVIAVWGASRGGLGVGLLLTGVLVFASALLSFTTAGNVVSILFPARRDMASFRSSPSQTGILLSFLSLALSLALLGLFQLPALLLDRPVLRPLLLAALLLLQCGLYLLTLGWASRLLAARKERFIETLGRRG